MDVPQLKHRGNIYSKGEAKSFAFLYGYRCIKDESLVLGVHEQHPVGSAEGKIQFVGGDEDGLLLLVGNIVQEVQRLDARG